MTQDQLARSIRQFLADSRDALVLEDGQVMFDLAAAQYSVSTERDRCLLHLWSEEHNLVRHVIDAELRNGALRLTVRRFAQARPTTLEILKDRERRPASEQKAARNRYARMLERSLRRHMGDWQLDSGRLATSMDLEQSFSPVYARGLLRKGRSALAVLGAGRQETQAAIDASLTFGLLWLQACREREAGRCQVEGLQLYVPRGCSLTLQLRLSHLNHAAARFQLFEFEERDETVDAIDYSDTGNIDTRLVRCPDVSQARSRFATAISRVLAVAPEAEVSVLSPSEIAFRICGLDCARARAMAVSGAFQVKDEITFGPPGNEISLTVDSAAGFSDFVSHVAAVRKAGGDPNDPLWRMYPERWLESLVFRGVNAIDSRLDPARAYSQVPAFSATDRAMIDVLTCTLDGRLAVLELKADEDIHLPLQGLDYWARVVWHHARGEFQQYGYFPGVQLSPRPPLLMLVSPSLRVHPATDTLLRFFAPEIEWMLIGLDERWRNGLKVIYRKVHERGPVTR